METRIKICDICKKEVRENDKIEFSSFAEISIDFQDRWCLGNPERGGMELTQRHYHLCSSCAIKLGMIRSVHGEPIEQLPSDSLFNLIAGIVEQVIEQRRA